jgi:hypothetical protein
MQWIDVERRAKEYEVTFPEGMIEPTHEFSYARRKGCLSVYPAIRDSAYHFDSTSLQLDLERLQVEEVLELLLREKWTTGRIDQVYTSRTAPKPGFNLVSEPYPKFSIFGKGKNTQVGREEEDTALSVCVFPSEYEGVNSFEVRDEHIYDLTQAQSVSLPEAIQDFGLEKGLKQSVSAAYVRRISAKTTLSTRDPNAFFWAIHKHTLEREALRSMPTDIASWSDSLLQQLPDKWHQAVLIKSGDLRKWGHEQKGNPNWVRIVDRIWPWGLGL